MFYLHLFTHLIINIFIHLIIFLFLLLFSISVIFYRNNLLSPITFNNKITSTDSCVHGLTPINQQTYCCFWNYNYFFQLLLLLKNVAVYHTVHVLTVVTTDRWYCYYFFYPTNDLYIIYIVVGFVAKVKQLRDDYFFHFNRVVCKERVFCM